MQTLEKIYRVIGYDTQGRILAIIEVPVRRCTWTPRQVKKYLRADNSVARVIVERGHTRIPHYRGRI